MLTAKLEDRFKSHIPATGIENVLNNIRINSQRDLPWLRVLPEHKGTVCIVGGGPTLKDTWPKLKKLAKNSTVIATNRTPDYLKQRGIKTDIHFLLDAQKEMIQFVDDDDKTWLVCSGCDPTIFGALEGKRVVMFHAGGDLFEDELIEIIREDGRSCSILGGGETGTHKAIEAAFVMGFRDFKIFGLDASGKGHAYKGHSFNHGDMKEIEVLGRTFNISNKHYRQAGQYEHQHKALLMQGCKIRAYGNSLIPHLAREINRGAPPIKR